MSFARKTYDTDSIVLRTVIARTSTDQNISSGKVLVAQGDGSTAWMYPSTLPGIPAFTRVIGNGTEIVADNLSSALVLSTTDSMGMLTNSTTKEIRFYAKAFTTIDISGDNSVSAFNTTTNTLTPTVELVGAGGIQISSDPQTNQIFFQTVVPAISTGIYGYHQVNVLSNAPSTITDDNFSTNNTYLTATSPSTVLQLAGLGDILLQTDTTNQVTYIGISTFTTASFQAVSTAAGLTQTTGSTLSTTIGSNTSSLWFSTNIAMNSTNTQFQANFNYINNFYTPLNDYQDLSTFVQSSFANTVGLSSFSTLEASTFTAKNIGISSALISSAVVQKEVVSTLEVSSATVNHAEISSLVVSSLTGIDFGGDFSTTLLYIQGPSNVAVGAEELRYIQGTSTLVIGDNVSTNYITVNAKDKSFNAISEFVHPFLELGYYPNDTNYSNVQITDNYLQMSSDNPASEFAVLAENLRLQCANGTLQLWASSTQLLTSMYPEYADLYDLGSSFTRFREFYVSSMWAQNAELENVNISAGLNTLNISTGILNAGDTLNVYAPSTIFSGDLATNTIHATGDILPTLSSTFDLGSPELPWRDLYLSAASLYLSTTRVSLDATGNLTVAIGGGSAYTIGTTDAPVSSFASSFTNVAHVSSLIASSITAVNFIYLSSVQDSYYISTLNLDAQEVTFSTSIGEVTSTASLLASSVNGVKGSDLVSTGQVTSTVTGLGTVGYISSSQLTSTVTGLGTAGYISSTQLTSTVTGVQRNLGVSSLAVSSLTQVGAGTISSLTVSTIAQVGSATFSTLAVSSFAFTTLSVSSLTASTIAMAVTGTISSLAVSSITTAVNIHNTLRVNTGNAGVNIAATQGTLEVADTSANAEVVALYLRNNSTPTSNITTLGFGTATNSLIGQAQIAVGNVGTSGAGYIALRTYSTSMNERVRIMDTGNVGIGTTIPAERLDVNGGMLVGNTTTSTGLLRITPFSNEMYIQAGLSNTTGSATKLHFSKFLTTSNAMTIDLSTMYVGIGTSTPTYQLTLTGDIGMNNNGTIFARNSAGTYESFLTPRGSDDITYFRYASGGLKIRNSNTTIMQFTNDSIGIGTIFPYCKLQVDGSTSNASGTHFAAFTGVQYNTAASTLMANINTNVALMTTVGTANDLIIYYRANGQNRISGIVGSAFFTGQHANVSVDSNLNISTLTDHVGKIVRSTGKYMSFQNGSTITGKDAIFTTEALPTIELVSKDMDKSVWGVVTNHRNDTFNDDGKPMLDHQSGFGDRIEDRIRVNGVGEGAIWITNINGNLENGDYICSSAVPGYGRKQDDDLLHNYTVAKITMSCDFTLEQEEYVCEEFEWNGSTLRKAYVGCTYHCS